MIQTEGEAGLVGWRTRPPWDRCCSPCHWSRATEGTGDAWCGLEAVAELAEKRLAAESTAGKAAAVAETAEAADGKPTPAHAAGKATAAHTAGKIFAGQVAGQTFAGHVAGQTFADHVAQKTFAGQVAGKTFAGQVAGKTFAGQVAGKTFAGQAGGQRTAEWVGLAASDPAEAQEVAPAVDYGRPRAMVAAGSRGPRWLQRQQMPECCVSPDWVLV